MAERAGPEVPARPPQTAGSPDVTQGERLTPPVGDLATVEAEAEPTAPARYIRLPTHDDDLTPGTQVGRYTLQRRLGAGGMGVVYAAHDTALDRMVALKLVRADRVGATDADAGHRLMREAQALAKLSHPNVVVVHDLGLVGDRLFIAVELVEGGSISEWKRRNQPDWRAVLQVYLAAGRGLAAAHDAGLIHRDFKPENVLVGNDGRVRVTDFGLARRAVMGEQGSSQSASTLSMPVTRPGTMVGTPAYMAPEQIVGGEVGPASDQFGFCVALYETLYGHRPFEGKSAGSLAHAVMHGRLREPPADTPVPRWIFQVLRRGLSALPKDRHPSMHAVLGLLSRDSAARRRRLGFAVAAGLVVAGATIALRAALAPAPARLEGLSVSLMLAAARDPAAALALAQRGLLAASRDRDDDLVAVFATDIVGALVRLGRYAEAEAATSLAEAAVTRAGASRAELDGYLQEIQRKRPRPAAP